MAVPPGSCGLPVVGDKSLEFYKDSVGFVEKRMSEQKSRVFQARFLTKPTTFLACSPAVNELLNDCTDKVDLGYKSFMHQIYGDNILFADGKEAEKLRKVLEGFFSADNIPCYEEAISRLIEKHLSNLSKKPEVAAYTLFKHLMTEICLTVFLDISFQNSQELASTIVDLTTTHWHGIISVPLNLRIPGIMSSSGYGKALEAKTKLLQLIKDKLESDSSKCADSFPNKLYKEGFSSIEQACNHLLLLCSALVPKALASLMTSFIMVTSRNPKILEECRQDSSTLDAVWLEVQRMYPPLAAGRRLIRKDCEVGGYRLQEGTACMYMTRAAQRDPQVFTHPDEFLPDRWKGRNSKDRNKLYLFGSGPRKCIGEDFVNRILRTSSEYLLHHYTWSLPAGQDLTMKWLPVSRPKEGVSVAFTKIL